MCELWTAIYPSNRARTATKLWENAFQTICNFWFFDAKQFFRRKIFKTKLAQNQLIDVLKELRWFERHRHVRRQKSLPVVRLFSLYDPWWGGKSGTPCFLGRFWTKNDFNHIGIMSWSYDIIISWWYDVMMKRKWKLSLSLSRQSSWKLAWTVDPRTRTK